MTTPSGETPVGYLQLLGLWPLSAYRVRSIVAIILAVCPPIVCAWLAENSGRWELFERSGSITAAIGLVVASRRYIEYGMLELAMLRAADHVKPNIAEVLEDIFTAKLGLGISAFGIVISGWGAHLGWWSFGYLVIWALFAVRDVRRDLSRAALDGLR